LRRFWRRGGGGGKAPSTLALTLGWGSVDPPSVGMGCLRAMGGFASHRLGLLCVGFVLIICWCVGGDGRRDW